jgi:hypothetical protein
LDLQCHAIIRLAVCKALTLIVDRRSEVALFLSYASTINEVESPRGISIKVKSRQGMLSISNDLSFFSDATQQQRRDMDAVERRRHVQVLPERVGAVRRNKSVESKRLTLFRLQGLTFQGTTLEKITAGICRLSRR